MKKYVALYVCGWVLTARFVVALQIWEKQGTSPSRQKHKVLFTRNANLKEEKRGSSKSYEKQGSSRHRKKKGSDWAVDACEKRQFLESAGKKWAGLFFFSGEPGSWLVDSKLYPLGLSNREAKDCDWLTSFACLRKPWGGATVLRRLAEEMASVSKLPPVKVLTGTNNREKMNILDLSLGM